MISRIDNMVVRQMRRTDIETVMQIKNAEKWNQTEQDWQFLMGHDPENCLVACTDHSVIGTVTAINYANQVAWIGMMLVSKEFRGIGVSKTLLNTIIEKLKDCRSIKLDATPAGIPVYKKLGFQEEYGICRMTTPGMKPIQANNHNSDIGIDGITKSGISALAKADTKLFGVDRKNLLQFLLKEQKNICCQVKQDGQVMGYVFGRQGSNYVQVGPLMSESVQITRVLLESAFKKLKGKPIVVDVLMDKNELINWLSSLGFVQQRKFTRMYLKSNDHSGMVEKQYLIGGPELG